MLTVVGVGLIMGWGVLWALLRQQARRQRALNEKLDALDAEGGR
jgi:hypothetical protein